MRRLILQFYRKEALVKLCIVAKLRELYELNCECVLHGGLVVEGGWTKMEMITLIFF